MNYHKIPNVELTVCTAEQKVAYNLAAGHCALLKKEFDPVNAANPGAARNDCARLSHWLMDLYRKGYSYRPGRYDEDAIFSALAAGLYDFLCNPFIAGCYESIGKAFPALYLKTKKE